MLDLKLNIIQHQLLIERLYESDDERKKEEITATRKQSPMPRSSGQITTRDSGCTSEQSYQ